MRCLALLPVVAVTASALLFFSVMATGCTHTTTTTTPTANADDTEQPDAAPPSSSASPPPLASDAGSGAPHVDAAPPPPPAPVEAGADAGADAGDPTSIASLFPAVVGHSWTFTIQSDFAECAGEHTGAVLQAKKVDGRDAFLISSYCDGVSPAAVSLSATSADVDVNGQYVSQLAEPVAEGATFQGLNGKTTWHKEPSVTVPAGTFQNCWRAVSGATFVTYCPGAGTVHIYEDTGNGVIDAQLKAKNF